MVRAKIWIGRVSAPDAITSAVLSYSFQESVNPNRNAPKSPVQTSGSVTSRNVARRSSAEVARGLLDPDVVAVPRRHHDQEAERAIAQTTPCRSLRARRTA